MEVILLFVGLVVALILLNIAAWRWGINSRDSINSEEWERRRTWNI